MQRSWSAVPQLIRYINANAKLISNSSKKCADRGKSHSANGSNLLENILLFCEKSEERQRKKMSTAGVANGKQQTDTRKNAPDGGKPRTNEAPNAARQIPDWLKADLFVELLQKNIPNFKCIKNFKVRPAQAAGENYATLMGLVSIDVELECKWKKHSRMYIKI